MGFRTFCRVNSSLLATWWWLGKAPGGGWGGWEHVLYEPFSLRKKRAESDSGGIFSAEMSL